MKKIDDPWSNPNYVFPNKVLENQWYIIAPSTDVGRLRNLRGQIRPEVWLNRLSGEKSSPTRSECPEDTDVPVGTPSLLLNRWGIKSSSSRAGRLEDPGGQSNLNLSYY